MIDRLARLANGRPLRTLVLAGVFFAVAGALGAGVADRLDPYGADDPDTESVIADQRLQDAGFRETGVVVLVRPAARARALAAQLRRDRDVAAVTRGPVSRDGRSTYVAVVFKDEQGKELFDLPDAPRPDPETPAPVRFLGEFDNVLLSFAERSRIIRPEDWPRIYTANGIIRATILIDGIRLTTESLPGQIGTLLAVAVIFGIVNAVLRPIIKTIGCGLYILTLGLIAIVVNGLLFLFASWIAGQFDLPFHVDNFWPAAVLGALLVGVVSWLLNALVPDGRDDD